MPLPRKLAKLNRAGLNRLTSLLASWLPPLALVEHRGRISGATYQTPVMVFRSGDTWRIALTYGPTTDWVHNLLAADGGVLIYRRQRYPVQHPRIDSNPQATETLPFVVRIVVRALNAHEVLEVFQV